MGGNNDAVLLADARVQQAWASHVDTLADAEPQLASSIVREIGEQCRCGHRGAAGGGGPR